MTTRIHIVNFGPKTVEVSGTDSQAGSKPIKVFPLSTADFYVFDTKDIVVKEQKDQSEPKKV